MAAPHPANPVTTRSELSASLASIIAAASRGLYELLFAETERAFARIIPGVASRVLMRSGGAWREWSALNAGQDRFAVALPEDSLGWDRVRRHDSILFVPISIGAICVVVDGGVEGVEASDDLDILRQCVELALQNCELQRIASQNLDEVQSLQRVATRMLKSHDISEILLNITQEAKRLLDSDICGVLLREGDEVVMRRCVGNHSVETASLRMKPGQGLAGRVLEHREPASVEDYIASETISRDFFHLAQVEMVRSALAAPLLDRAEVIGVLEVWRRRPSTFTQMDSSRLVALANLASIAIENANLYTSQRSMVDELARANEALNQRYDAVRNLSSLTQSLLQMLLQGGGLAAIVASASSFLETDVAILDQNLQVRAWGGSGNTTAVLPAMASALGSVGASRSADRLDLGEQDGCWVVQPLLIEGEPLGWVLGRADRRGFDVTELAVAQVVMVAALYQLEQRAASRARAETIDALVWDIIQGDEAAQASAIDRAAENKIELTGPMRLFICELGPSRVGGSDRSASAVRRQITQVISDAKPSSMERIRAITLRGLTVAIICSDEPLDDAERWADRLARTLMDELAGRLVLVGGSSRCAEARGLTVAYRESLIALDVVRQLGRSGAVVYDRAGVVGMLLSLRHEAGMQRFLELNLGDLLREKQRDVLLETLRAFFDTNCSQEAAAQRLGVHRKTISYRLDKVAELTGLDLSTHDDRLVADLSLYVYRLLAGQQT
ncbi:Purine catabolism regulatory protein [Hydrogenophaga sp. T4]|nr:Purine catabolism regulatory protein [Hydrogenophaga sp. T4]